MDDGAVKTMPGHLPGLENSTPANTKKPKRTKLDQESEMQEQINELIKKFPTFNAGQYELYASARVTLVDKDILELRGQEIDAYPFADIPKSTKNLIKSRFSRNGIDSVFGKPHLYIQPILLISHEKTKSTFLLNLGDISKVPPITLNNIFNNKLDALSIFSGHAKNFVPPAMIQAWGEKMILEWASVPGALFIEHYLGSSKIYYNGDLTLFSSDSIMAMLKIKLRDAVKINGFHLQLALLKSPQ